MKTVTLTIITVSIFLACLSASFAAKVKIINNTDDKVRIFFRGKGTSTHQVEVLLPNTIVPYKVNPSAVEGKPVFEVIASTTGGNPDWKLLSGVCSNLEIDKDYTLFIEKTFKGLKTSCTAIAEE